MRITNIKQALQILKKNNPYTNTIQLTVDLRKLTGWKKKTCAEWLNESLELGFVERSTNEKGKDVFIIEV